jgi:hypothetical protein
MKTELFQTDFFRQEAPTVAPIEVEQFVAILRGKGWRTAVQLGARTSSERRRLRATAQAANGRVIFGQKGYALTAESTQEDITHCVRWLRSAAAEMEKRAKEILLNMNQALPTHQRID